MSYVVYDTEMKRKQKLIYIIITCWFITILSIVIYSMLPANDYTQQIQDINTIDNDKYTRIANTLMELFYKEIQSMKL